LQVLQQDLRASQWEKSVTKKPILIVDDEKNIRLTMSRCLETLETPIRTAENAEEALRRLAEEKFGIVFLDLKMPGMDGLELLRQIKDQWPEIRVIIMTAYGTIQSAVDAMKLGAVDFIQKPFMPDEIRSLARLVLERDALDKQSASDYESLIELTKLHISNRSFDSARITAQQAIAGNPGKPEAYNLLGALLEIGRDSVEAQKFYRAALDIDPTFEPARTNLDRTTSRQKFGKIDLGPDQKECSSNDEI
jgi:DNA-binding response OmpR family regulator